MARDIDVVVDGKTENLSPDAFNTLDEIVGDLVRRLVPMNRLVTKVIVNGEDVSEENQSRLAGTSATDVKKIEVQTEPLSEAVTGALDRSSEYLERLCEGVRICVDKYRSGNETDAHRLLAQCLEGLVWFVSFSTNIRVALRADYDSEYFQGETLTAKQNRLFEHIRELEKAQKNMDVVYMADLMEFEIEPILKDWIEVFASFHERTAAARQGGGGPSSGVH